MAQENDTEDLQEEKASMSRLERKAAGYEHNIKKIKEKGRALLDEDPVNYAKIKKLKYFALPHEKVQQFKRLAFFKE